MPSSLASSSVTRPPGAWRPRSRTGRRARRCSSGRCSRRWDRCPRGPPVGPTSRAWYEELRLAPVVAEALRGRGLDEGAAWWAAERVHTLLDLPLPSSPGRTGRDARGPRWWTRGSPTRPSARSSGSTRGRASTTSTASRGRSSWPGWIDWSGSSRRATSGSKRPVELSVLERTLTDAAEASGYRVDGLREALGGGPRVVPARTGPARLPKATGLPPGPTRGVTHQGRARQDRPEAEEGQGRPGVTRVSARLDLTLARRTERPASSTRPRARRTSVERERRPPTSRCQYAASAVVVRMIESGAVGAAQSSIRSRSTTPTANSPSGPASSSLRSRWSSSTSSRISSGSRSRCHRHSRRRAASASPSGAAACAARIA